jgi:hypothetical protein
VREISVTRKKRSNRELRDVSNHLWYELEMLNAATWMLANAGFGQDDHGLIREIQNALLESFCIHSRNLMEFLYPTTPKNDAVIAEDFFDDKTEWLRKRPPQSESLKDAHIRAHKEVAHLTYARLLVTSERKPWAFLNIAKEISEVFRVFYQLVPFSTVTEDFLSLAAQVLGVESRAASQATKSHVTEK